jgi:uncharacterized OB-fold protein
VTVPYDRPLPAINADSRPFWEACRDHVLQFQQCTACGHLRWPPSGICPQCHAGEARWVRSSGRGQVFSYVVYHMAFHPAFAADVPYVVAVVKLVEGPLLLTSIVQCDPGDVHCDLDVTVVWDDVTPEISLPKFRPAASMPG